MKEKIFKYRDTTETFEETLATVMHSNLYRFEIVRDRGLYLNFYENNKIKYCFDVDRNKITKYEYIPTFGNLNIDVCNYIANKVHHINTIFNEYEYLSKRIIKDTLNTRGSYTFKNDYYKRVFFCNREEYYYRDKTQITVFYKGGGIICD